MVFSNYSINFDGTGDNILIGDKAPFKFDVGDAFSVSLWFKTTTDNRKLISKLQSAPFYTGWEIGMSGGAIYMQIIDDYSVPQRTDVFGGGSLEAGQWVHAVVTKDTTENASGIKIYIDGYAVGTLIYDDTFVSGGGTSFDTTTSLEIGARIGTSVFTGNIDDVAIYNTELTAAEVLEIHNGGFPTDNRELTSAPYLVGYWTTGDGDTYPTLRDRQVANPTVATGASIFDRSQNSNDGTPTNMEDSDFQNNTPGGVVGYSAKFDGLDEYVTWGNIAAVDLERTFDWSFSFWMNCSGSPGDDQFILSKQTSGNPEGWVILVQDSGHIVFYTIHTFGSNYMGIRMDVSARDGYWHHVAVTYDSSATGAASGYQFYYDGYAETVITVADSLSSDYSSAAAFIAGTRELDFTKYYDGYLDDVSFFTRTLTQNEIDSIYNFGQPTDVAFISDLYSDLVGYWGMGEDANDGTMTLMAANDIQADGAQTIIYDTRLDNSGLDTYPFIFAIQADSTNNLPLYPVAGVILAGDPSVTVTTYYMRGIDTAGPYPSYHTWSVTDTPDSTGTYAGTLPYGGPLTEIVVIGVEVS